MRKFRAGGIAVGVFLVLALSQGEARGDWIQLKNGVQIHGKILRESDDEITLELDRGGTSSFEMKTVLSVHRIEPETRKKLRLEDEPKDVLPAGIHPRPDAIRSARRPVPGGTLLLPEEVVREAAPVTGESPEDGSKGMEAHYRLGRTECRILVGREPAAPDEEAQTERLRERIRVKKNSTLHALEVQRIAGLSTWVAEWTEEVGEVPIRHVEGWVLISDDMLQVIRVELPDAEFNLNPYRYRVIPRSFRPQGKNPDTATAAGSRN